MQLVATLDAAAIILVIFFVCAIVLFVEASKPVLDNNWKNIGGTLAITSGGISCSETVASGTPVQVWTIGSKKTISFIKYGCQYNGTNYTVKFEITQPSLPSNQGSYSLSNARVICTYLVGTRYRPIYDIFQVRTSIRFTGTVTD